MAGPNREEMKALQAKLYPGSPVFPARKPFLITSGANLSTVNGLRAYDIGFVP